MLFLSGCSEHQIEFEDNVLQDTEEDTLPEASIEDMETEPEELFDSQGVFIQLLAEGDESLSEAERTAFLEQFGFGESTPFYIHTTEDGYPLMELYYDEEREIGCGIRYGENVSGVVICGFAFNSCYETSWYEPDPYSVLSVYGTSGEDDVTDYEEIYEYDEEGRLVHFQSNGTPAELYGDEDVNMPILNIDFIYDEQGQLIEKRYWHNTAPQLNFGTTFASQYSHYDESGRLAHTSSYITHGSLEGYYIYLDEGDVPAYYLELDHMYTSWPTFYRYRENEKNWEFGSFRRSTEAQFHTYEIEPGEEMEFLAEQGFSEEDLFYEYEYVWDYGPVFRLALYCDEELTKGVGLIRRYYIEGDVEEYINLEIFTFDGYESYLYDAVSPFHVFGNYNGAVRYTTFLQGETIEEYFQALGLVDVEDIHSVSFDYDADGKLTHMYQGVTHGSVDRFYIYREGWGIPSYLLEVDHGWGVTFYKF